MDPELQAFDPVHPWGIATHPLARLLARLPVSCLLAGPGLPRHCFSKEGVEGAKQTFLYVCPLWLLGAIDIVSENHLADLPPL